MSIRAGVAIALISIQLALLGVILFGDFDYIFPGTMGSITAWLGWIVAYVASLFFGVTFACMLGEFRIAALQLAVPAILALLAYLSINGVTFDPTPPDFHGASELSFVGWVMHTTRESVATDVSCHFR